MDSSGLSSPRPDCFPAGLRVLVVDDDPTWLKILEKMLKKCNYEVRTCNLAREALDMLRERKDGYDIVISDVNMPDMDGFKLLEHVGLEMDLPVIMMSVDGETSRVMKGVQHGACDYLLKPIRMKELRNIWQHVFRKRIHEVRDIEGHESLEELQMMRSAAELSDDGFFFGGEGKKRKDLDHDRVYGGDSSSKKARVVWTVDLHQKFVKAVNLIGFEKVGPKKILDLMGVPWLTRENVASHLQKYRLYLSRLQKENELKAALNGTKQSELPQKDNLANVCSKIPIVQDAPKISEAKVKAIEPIDLAKSSTPSMTFDHSFRPLTSDAMSEPKIQVHYSWRAGVPPFKQEHKPHEVEAPLIHFKKEDKPPFSSEHRFDHRHPLPLHQIQIDYGEASANHGTKSKAFNNKPEVAGNEPSFSKITRSQQSEKVTKVESTAALFSVQPQSESFEQSPFNEKESWNRKAIQWEEGFTQSDIYPLYPYLGTTDPFSFNAQELIPDARFDSLKFPIDPLEYSVIDQGVYIS